MQKQICYKDEVKPSGWIFIWAIFGSAFTLAIIYLCFYYFDTSNNIYKEVYVIVAYIVMFFTFATMPIIWFKSIKIYKKAMAVRNNAIQNGEKFKGHIIKTEITTHTRSGYRGAEIVVY